MRYYIGADGGGTKTAFALADENARILSRVDAPGSSYKMYGLDAVLERLRSGVDDCLAGAGIKAGKLAGLCLGMPCYGENPEADARLKAGADVLFSPAPVLLVNDAEVGWAGSLSCRAGINIVAGTGSIAFGRDGRGAFARSGGWNEFFGDEGSCYWVGRYTMELFSKQADGRIPRGALYELIRREFSLDSDFAFLDRMEQNYQPLRDRVAGLQLLTEQAARAGDASCVALYEKAAQELALIVAGVKNQLSFAGETRVSYSGGLFRAGELVLTPFTDLLTRLDCVLQHPEQDPLTGAVLLAIQNYIRRN